MSEEKEAPVCPDCGAVAVWRQWHWETFHEQTCPWLRDPNSPVYAL